MNFQPPEEDDPRDDDQRMQEAERRNPCRDCGGSGMDGDVGERGQTITIDCSNCKGTGEQPTAPQGVASVTDAMVTAYLEANDAYWKRTDALPTGLVKWRSGTPREATRESLIAALAQAGQAAPHPAWCSGGCCNTEAALAGEEVRNRIASLLGALKQTLAVCEEWQVGLTARTVAKAAIKEAEALAPATEAAPADEWEKLRDPEVLHANLLRGIPAKLTRRQLLHLVGGDAIAWDNALATPATEPAAPGYVSVPVEPTEAMVKAAFDAVEINSAPGYANGDQARIAAYRAMLAAAGAQK